MQKLLTKYREQPTLKNAMNVRKYERSHMMSVCMLSREDQNLVADAIYHANQGFVRPPEGYLSHNALGGATYKL